MNCSSCKHVTNGMSGSHHVGCIKGGRDTLTSMQVSALIMCGLRPEKVKLSEHGIKNGWCNWPLDFDQIWVEECELYENKTVE